MTQSLKYFLDPSCQDALTQESLRLKERLAQTPFYASMEAKEGDHLWIRLAITWKGALISPQEVKDMEQRKQGIRETTRD